MHSHALVYPQDEHERLLIARLAAAGVAVERQTELLALDEKADRVHAVLKTADGSEDQV